MNHETIRSFYAGLQQQRILLSFHGLFTQRMMVEYGRLLQKREEMEPRKRRILFGVFVELTENILRYSAETVASEEGPRGVGVIVVSESAAGYQVISGNLVTHAQGERVREICESLRGKTREELRLLFREHRRLPREPGARGAGLGLIEVASRSDTPMSCQISPVDENHSFLSLSIEILKDHTP